MTRVSVTILCDCGSTKKIELLKERYTSRFSGRCEYCGTRYWIEDGNKIEVHEGR